MRGFFKSLKDLGDYLNEKYPEDEFSGEAVLDSLKTSLQVEIKKRGIFADITVAWSGSTGLRPSNLSFLLNSEEFNTTPVIFEGINLKDHASYICVSEGTGLVEFVLYVHARYKHFNYGQNGCLLFSVKGVILPDKVTNLYIFH